MAFGTLLGYLPSWLPTADARPSQLAVRSRPTDLGYMTADFYHSSLAVETYDLLTAQANAQIKGDVAFYLECARDTKGPVLELGCGTGRVAWALASCGFEVVGLDSSKEMLAAAKRKARDLPPEVRLRAAFVQAEMQDFALERDFALALIPFTAFQHLARPAEQHACLGCLHRHLRPQALLVIDMFDPVLDACAPGAPSPNPDRIAIDPVTGDTIRRKSVARRNAPLDQLVTETFRIERISPSGQVLTFEDVTHQLRWACRQEMIYLFERCDFEVIAQFSDFARNPPVYGRRQIWMLTPRPQ